MFWWSLYPIIYIYSCRIYYISYNAKLGYYDSSLTSCYESEDETQTNHDFKYFINGIYNGIIRNFIAGNGLSNN